MKQLVRYFWVGACAALLDLVFFGLFHNLLGLNYLAVGIAGFVLATLLNYLLSIRWVFTSGARFGRGMEIASVYGVSLVGLLLHAMVLIVAVESLTLPPLVAKVLATGLVFFWNFAARRYFVFAPKR